MSFNSKLAAMNSYGWYTPPITVADNTGKVLGTSSAIKGSGISVPCRYVFSWFFFCFFKNLRLTENSWKRNYVLWNNSLFEMFD